jgi:hypothetical protein
LVPTCIVNLVDTYGWALRFQGAGFPWAIVDVVNIGVRVVHISITPGWRIVVIVPPVIIAPVIIAPIVVTPVVVTPIVKAVGVSEGVVDLDISKVRAPGIPRVPGVPTIPGIPALIAIPAAPGPEIIIDQHGHAGVEEGVVVEKVYITGVVVAKPCVRPVKTTNTRRIVIIVVVVIFVIIVVVTVVVYITRIAGAIVISSWLRVIIITGVCVRVIVEVIMLGQCCRGPQGDHQNGEKRKYSFHAFHIF